VQWQTGSVGLFNVLVTVASMSCAAMSADWLEGVGGVAEFTVLQV